MKPNMRLFLLLFMICAPLPCQAQWRWLYPSLRGEFRSCVMASADHTYILTASDSVLETRDQGATWTTMEVDGLPTFGVFFRPSLGFLVVRDRDEGSNLLLSWHILKTSDGGQSWNRLPPTFGDVVDVYFGTDSLGWLTLRTGAGLHTTDGGQTWEPNAPGTPPIIRWMDRNTWYGYRHYSTENGRKDSVLWYSFDGGATWEARAFTAFPGINPRYVVQSVCLSMTSLASGSQLAMYTNYMLDPKTQSSTIQMSLARSIDSGRSWNTVYNPYFITPTSEIQTAFDPLPRAFPYRFLTIHDTVLSVVFDNGRGWFASSDDGQTWAERDSLFAYYGTVATFDSDHHGNVVALSTTHVRIQWSTTAGATWSPCRGTEVINTLVGRSLLATHASGIVLEDDSAPYYLALSRNGTSVIDGVLDIAEGANKLFLNTSGPCSSLDEHRALLVGTGYGTYQMTELTDNKEWVPISATFQKPSPQQTKLGASYHLGSGRTIITADHGIIYCFMENEQEWKRVDSVSRYIVNAADKHHVKFSTRDEGVCVSFVQHSVNIGSGMDSLVYDLVVRTTSDGGRNWSRTTTRFQQFVQYIPASVYVMSPISILRVNTYLTGNPDGIRKTTDWGETWTLVCLTSESIQSISAVDSLRAFATTEHELLGTVDGGQTWSHITPRDASGNILSAGRFTKVFTSPSGFVLACLPDGFIGGMADSILTGVDRPEPVLPTDPLRIYPNPGVAGGTVRIQFSQQTAGFASITLYSSLGQRLHHEILDDRHVGLRETTLGTTGLPPGLYFVAVSTPEGVRVGKVVVRK